MSFFPSVRCVRVYVDVLLVRVFIVHIRICVHLNVYRMRVCMCVCVCEFICVSMSVYECIRVCSCLDCALFVRCSCACMCVRVCVCVCLCVCVSSQEFVDEEDEKDRASLPQPDTVDEVSLPLPVSADDAAARENTEEELEEAGKVICTPSSALSFSLSLGDRTPFSSFLFNVPYLLWIFCCCGHIRCLSW